MPCGMPGPVQGARGEGVPRNSGGEGSRADKQWPHSYAVRLEQPGMLMY